MTSTPLKVLLVEDSPVDARLVRKLLGDAGREQLDLTHAGQLSQAVESIRRESFDAILLDLYLPDSRGLETFARTYEESSDVPILVLTVLDDEELAIAAVREGAQDYLVKGQFDGQSLRRAIQHSIERKRAETHIRWLTQAVEQSPASVFITDLDGKIQYVNHTFTKSTGYTSAEVIGRTPRMFKSGLTSIETYRALWDTILAGETWRGEMLNRRRNGKLYWDSVVISPVRDARGTMKHFLAVQEDITERKQSEDALLVSERRLRTLFDTVNLIVLGLDAEGRVAYANPFLLKLTGYTADQALGSDWFERFLPVAQRPRMHSVFRELIEREFHPHYQNPIVTRTGEERMIAWHNTVVRDAQGRATGTLSIGEDITDHALLEEQFRQAQKMEALGQLAGGVAHDFNNLLTVINGYSELVMSQLDPADPMIEDLELVKRAGERAAALTRQLLAFSRKQVLQPKLLDLNLVVADVDKMLRRLIGEDIELVTVLERNLKGVRADAGQIEQVLMNLAVNARDAMRGGGKLTIETCNVELDESYAASHADAKPGQYVMLAISDTGTGMSAATQARMFEPFFTTKEQGKGTGLGLATVYGIVKQSDGHINVYSELGQGTTFKVYLPAVDASGERIAPSQSDSATRGGTETVLLVEDDESVRKLAREVLQRQGYTVLQARDGVEALEVCRAHAGPIHVIVTDVVMPAMGGPESAHRLKAIRPDIKVLYVSGYHDRALTGQQVLDPDVSYLQKPFTTSALARKVREVLDG
jgi:PAS domain S-box-containing protein